MFDQRGQQVGVQFNVGKQVARYRIGKVQDPRDDDPTYPDWQAALSAALDMSGQDTWVIAIWDMTGDIEALVYQGWAYMH